MKSSLIKYLPFLGIALFAWFYVERLFLGNFIIYGEEQGFLNYDFVNYRYQGIWDSTRNFGNVSINVFNRFTLGLVWSIAAKLSLDSVATEKFYFFIVIFSTLCFFFLLIRKVTRSTHVAFLLSFIYVTAFNYYVVILTTPKFLHFLILPASIYLWLKFEERFLPRYLIFNVMLLLLTLGISVNPPQMLGAYCFIFLYILMFSTKTKFLPKVIYQLPYLLITLYVFVANYLVIGASSDLYRGDIFGLNWSAINSEIFDIIRLFGAWWDYAGYMGIIYNHLGGYYHSPLGIIISYIPFVLALILLYVSRIKISEKAKILALLIIFIFFTKGNHEPFGGFFMALFSFPIFHIFREPWAKFIPDFIFAVFFGVALLLRNVSQRVLIGSFIALYIVLVFQLIPLIRSEALDHRIQDWKIADVQIPSYWQDLKRWSFKYAQNKRILVLPYIPPHIERTVNDWQPLYYFGNPSEFLLYSHVISSAASDPVDEVIMPAFFNSLSPKTLVASSVDYVLDNKDLRYRSAKNVTIKDIEPALDSERALHFGSLDLYPVRSSFASTPIRTVSSILQTPNVCDLNKVSVSKDPSDSAVLFNTPALKIQPVSNIPITVTDLSNSLYKVEFTGTVNNNVGLLFTQRYNSGWKLYNSDSIFASPILNDSHHKVANCFVNFWQIPQEVLKQNKTLYIRFLPQRNFMIVSYVGILSLLGTIGIGYIFYFKQKKNNDK